MHIGIPEAVKGDDGKEIGRESGVRYRGNLTRRRVVACVPRMKTGLVGSGLWAARWYLPVLCRIRRAHRRGKESAGL